MVGHLLALAVGPVQGFISAARRTRDLWFGSLLLAKISQATAQAVRDCRGTLIFPSLNALAESEKPGARCNIANIILAKLPTDIHPSDVAESARQAADNCWRQYAAQTYEVAQKLINTKVWNEQLDDVVEFYAAWMPISSPDCYKDTRLALMRLLAGRKACRDFIQVKGHSGIPKSSLDGSRESVFVKQRIDILKSDQHLAQRLRLSRGEQLDAVGLTKRAATREAFASVVRVAADPWIRGIEKDKGDGLNLLGVIANECSKIMGYKSEEIPHVTGTGTHYKKTIFPYDAAVLYPNRLDSMLRADQEEVSVWTPADQAVFRKILNLLPQLQSPNKLGYGEPDPYLAILVADGDRMGKTISNIQDAEDHIKFSDQLATFAGLADGIVRNHNGCLVYSGGDDVLAFLPVDLCLDCARSLHDQFGTSLKDRNGNTPTLSVGIAIGHCLEHLEDLLNYARAAESAAKKPNRDGLAVHLYTRGGPAVKVRGGWKEVLDNRLKRWAQMHQHDQIPDKAAYDLRMLAKDYAGWPDTADTDKAIKKDVDRLLSRKRAGGQKLDLERLNSDLDRCFSQTKPMIATPHRHYHPEVMQLAEEWLIARRLAKAMRQAAGKKIQSPGGEKK